MKIISWNINNDYDYIDIDVKVQMIIELLNKIDVFVFGLQEVIPELYDKLYTRISKRQGLIKSYQISPKPSGVSYFTVLISIFGAPTEDIKFQNTQMGRSYLCQKLQHISFITTHLESLPMNISTRRNQITEILKYNNKYPVIIFGDMNFTNKNERFGKLEFIDFTKKYNNTQKNTYTYDSKLNKNATPPYRSNR